MVSFFRLFFSANAAAQASRKSFPRMANEAVGKAVSACFNCSLGYVVRWLLIFFPIRLMHWRVQIIAVQQMSVPDWMLNKRSSTFQSFQPPLLNPSLSSRLTSENAETADLCLVFIDNVPFFYWPSCCFLQNLLGLKYGAGEEHRWNQPSQTCCRSKTHP